MTKNSIRAYGGLVMALLISAASGCGHSMPADPLPNISVAEGLRSGGGGSGTTQAAVSTGTGWGTIKGVFKYPGTYSAGVLSTGGKDGAVCGASVPNQTLVVDSGSRGIANILVFPRKVSRIFDEYKAAPPKPLEFDQKGCLFLEHVTAVWIKDPMLMKNSDPVSHNINMSPPNNQPYNSSIAGGESSTYQFTAPLTAPVEATCSIHNWMKAYVLARNDPYFSVTKPDGKFEIANLPAGEELEFQVWHERAPGGLAAKTEWDRGRFKVKLEPNQTLDLGSIEVPREALP
jgi:hypothetical protein